MARIVDSFIEELEHEGATTRRVLERVPADKNGWKPHETSMTLGELAMHTARVPAALAGILSGDTFDIQDVGKQKADPNTPLLDAFDESIRSAKTALSGWDDRKMLSTWTLTKDGAEIWALPRLRLVRALMLNHWYHHRGQLTVYLRILGIPIPAVYGRSADEDPFAAAR